MEADQRAEECCKKLQAAASEREELQRLERQAMRRAQELSDSLLESHAQMKVLPAHLPSCRTQIMPVSAVPPGATAVMWQSLRHIHTQTGISARV